MRLTYRALGLLALALLLSAGGPARAGLILQPAAASTNMGILAGTSAATGK